MTDLLQYFIGLALCVIVAFLYSSTRKRDRRDAVHDGLVVLAWMVAALIVLGVFGYVGCRFF